MMKITVRAIGRLADDWNQQAVHRYQKLLSPYAKLEIIELPEGHKGSAKPDVERTSKAEAASLLKNLPDNALIVALDERGKPYSSEAFAGRLGNWAENGRHVVFLIGGSWGLDKSVLDRADEKLSLSQMTLPHALARIVLLEQLYRAAALNAGKTYHK